MAFVPFAGQFPMPLPAFAAPPLLNITSQLIDATGEKIAFMGYPQSQDIGKSLVSVGFRFGPVTKAGGSALTVSHQDVSLTVGPPEQPDEVIDGQAAIANANAAFVSSAWIDVAAFDVPRTITAAPFAIVIEYDVAGRLGADSVILTGHNSVSANVVNSIGTASLKTASWAAIGNLQNILFVFGDGTFGSFLDAYPCETLNITAYNTGSAVDEFALEFTVPVPIKVNAVWVSAVVPANSNPDIVLYDGITVMTTVSIDANLAGSTSIPRPIRVPLPTEQQLDPGHTYRLALKPTTATNVTVYDFTVNNANHLQAWPGGTAFYLATRVDAGAWTSIPTRRPLMGLYQSAISGRQARATFGLGV